MSSYVDKIWNCISCGAYNAGSNESCGQCNLSRFDNLNGGK